MSVEIPASSLLMPETWRATDVRDFAELVLRIAAEGIGRPFLVNTDLTVLHRHEEAAACRMLNLPAVPVEILDLEEMLAVGANGVTFLPAEAIAVGRVLEQILKPEAARRQAEGRARGAAARNIPPEERPPRRNGRTSVRDLVAGALGISSTSYSRAREVVVAAEEDPERFGDLVREMDKTNNIAGTHDELRRRQRPLGEAQAEEAPAPRRKAAGSLFKVMPGRDGATVIQNTLYSLLAAADTFDHVDLSLVTAESAESWAEDLKTVAKSLGRFRTRLTDKAKETTDGC